MKTEILLAQTLKKLMSNQVPLEEISVTTLTKKCKINRQTFYYHFHDIYDLLTLVFLNEKIEYTGVISNIDTLLEVVYSYYQTNKTFIDSTLESAAKDLCLTFFQNFCYQCLLKMIINADIENVTSISQRKNFATFYSNGFAKIICNYLFLNKSKNIETFKSLFAFLPKDFIGSAIRHFKKENSKHGN